MRVPVVPTIVVSAAVATMIGLGIWQLQRAEWKKGLLARYQQAAQLPPLAWPLVPTKPEQLYYRRADGFCLEVMDWRAIAGRNLRDEAGWAHLASCRTGAEGPGMQVDVGWSRSSDPPQWRGGPVSGIIAPDSRHGIRLVAAQPSPGLEASKPPAPDSVPNNHILYAIQWFFFAAAASVIYVLALRRRAADRSEPPSA